MSPRSEHRAFIAPGTSPGVDSEACPQMSHSQVCPTTDDTPGQPDPLTSLYTQRDLHEGKLPKGWAVVSYREFRRQVVDKDYPCTFAVAGEHAGTLRYAFVDDPATGINPQSLLELAALSQQHPENRHALAVFVRPEPALQSHEYYQKGFWDLLQKLHESDPQPWPCDVPKSPTDPKWEFCFGGQPMFVFAAAPSHFLRRSRNLGPSLVLLFQPRSVFRGIEGGTANGTRVRTQIRQRLAEWDLIGLHSSMGNYGDVSNFEASQYFIPDDDRPTPPCPLQIREAAAPQQQNPGTAVTPSPAVVTITSGAALGFEDAVRKFLPPGGSLSIQSDPPGKQHPLHTHAADETLYIMEGELLFRVPDRDVRVTPGTTIELPGGTLHSSSAGADGCLYLIAVH